MADPVFRITDLAPPPVCPVETGAEGAWDAVEARIGRQLPEDYKAIISRYGTGCFARFLWVFSPFAANGNLNLLVQIEKVLARIRQDQSEFRGDLPYPIFPEPGGLLPWGGTDNGHDLFWLTRGGPDCWSVVAYTVRDSEWGAYDGGISHFLYEWLSGSLGVVGFPRDSVSCTDAPTFEVRPDYCGGQEDPTP